MKFLKKIITITVFICCFGLSLNAYSYAAAGKEPTIDAKEKIFKAINENDFNKAKEIFLKNKKNYQYLNDNFINKLYKGLEQSIIDKNKKDIAYYLDLSLAAEVIRRLEGGLENIKTFNVSKVMLAKADKFYKLLSNILNENDNLKLKASIRACMEAIGNPGLFGVGAKEANIDLYIKNQKVVVSIILGL